MSEPCSGFPPPMAPIYQLLCLEGFENFSATFSHDGVLARLDSLALLHFHSHGSFISSPVCWLINGIAVNEAMLRPWSFHGTIHSTTAHCRTYAIVFNEGMLKP